MKYAAQMAILIGTFRAFAQVESPPMERTDVPQVTFDALVFAGDDTTASRLDVYVQVPYEALRFVQGENGYDAAYEETISIYDVENNLVSEQLSTQRVHRNVFAETVDPAGYNLTQRFFTLTPARYTIVVQVRDEETRKSTRAKREITVRYLHDGSLSVSDLMLVSQLRLDEDVKTIVPNISGNVGSLPDGFYLFCEVYNRTDCDTFEFTYQVKAANNVDRLQEHFSQPAKRGRNQVFVKINSAALPMGTYSVSLHAAACGGSMEKRQESLVVSHPFVVRWSGIPVSIEDLDAAVDQLVYAAEGKELEYIKSAPSMEEKKNRFYEFWKKRDPSPNSEQNETMEQYYTRVAFANKNFSHYAVGWRTDRGMVYIMFGAPNNVDRHPFERDAKPYEVWYYNDLNYRFLFVDQTGFGDYRLDSSTPLWNIKKRRR